MKKQSGFTLIELLLVLAIIGIISAIAIPAMLNQRGRAREFVGRIGQHQRLAAAPAVQPLPSDQISGSTRVQFQGSCWVSSFR